MSNLDRARAVVRIASRLVPARLRDEWQREWEGELAAATEPGRQQRLFRYSLGSFADAF